VLQFSEVEQMTNKPSRELKTMESVANFKISRLGFCQHFPLDDFLEGQAF